MLESSRIWGCSHELNNLRQALPHPWLPSDPPDNANKLTEIAEVVNVKTWWFDTYNRYCRGYRHLGFSQDTVPESGETVETPPVVSETVDEAAGTSDPVTREVADETSTVWEVVSPSVSSS
jgi:hypothetical protein